MALIAESGILPEANPRGLTTLHSGSRIQVIGLGFIRMYPGLLQPNWTSELCNVIKLDLKFIVKEGVDEQMLMNSTQLQENFFVYVNNVNTDLSIVLNLSFSLIHLIGLS